MAKIQFTKAILYARFSPRPTAAECESCAQQLQDLKKWSEENQIEVVGEYSDEALSGGDDWDDRPGMFSAATAAKRGTVFLVRAYDRLFRDVQKALVFRSMLETKGVEVYSISEPAANGSDPMAQMIRGVLLLIAEYQRHVTKALTRASMLSHQKSGRRMSKRPPWGTRIDPADPARLIPDEEEIQVAALIVELADGGMGFRAIARQLESAGIKRRGALDWHHSIVCRIYNRFSVGI